MSDDNTQASIAELKEAVSNLKEFTKRAETTLEALRKENKDGRHELRNEFQVKFITIENTIDSLRKDHDRKINILEKVAFMGIGGFALFELILKVLK